VAADSFSTNDRKAGSRTLLARIQDGSAIAILLVLLCLVLLPMLWMILTAFKTKGTAFQLAFLPQTTLIDPAPEAPGLEIAVVEPGTPALYLEWLDEGAISVMAEVTAGDRQSNSELRRGAGGFWSTVLSLPGFESGQEVSVVYTVNETFRQEPVTVTLTDGLTLPGATPALLGYREGGRLRFTVGQIPAGHTPSILIGAEKSTTRRVPLAGGPYVYTAEAEHLGETHWRVARKRPFGEALAARYTFENFAAILTNDDFNFGRYFFNSLVVAVSAGLITVFICTLAGYAFAQFEFHGREPLFGLLLTSMLVPGMIFMVPQFSITLQLGLMDSYAGMVIPHVANVFGLFLMRQYIGQIPRDLFAAAEIDGARQHQIFQTIVIPICLPIMVTLFLLVFVGQWSNFLWQLIINTGQSEVLTLPVGLQQFKGQNANEWEKIMAGACFSILPIAVLFLSLQKYFLQGLTAGAVKE
jgi:multiple sugar transport system permease protein